MPVSLAAPTGSAPTTAWRTKAQLLQSAAELFAERGFPTVTLQDVADRTGMARGAVYFHYKEQGGTGRHRRAGALRPLADASGRGRCPGTDASPDVLRHPSTRWRRRSVATS
ncbi:TetR family transcriptional regulator [Streptomyces sp. NPDC021562]|uniref:TetR family transcriptional regulator n=1 Tax=Streptomyces sp. NPDC021562 TaxID=3155121 RepID=UPI0033FA1B3C